MPWAVIMTKPNCENIAVANLVQQGYECYMPRYRQKHRHTILIKPLFPRYIFTMIVDTWWSIRGTRGVSYMLTGDDGAIPYVPEHVIKSIRASEDGEGYIQMRTDGVIERFHPGDKVMAKEGPLLARLLTYEKMTAKDRVQVLFTAMGRECRLELDEKILVAA